MLTDFANFVVMEVEEELEALRLALVDECDDEFDDAGARSIRGEPVLPTYNECTRLPVCIGRVDDVSMVHWHRVVILEAVFNRMFVKSFQWPCTIAMMIR